MTVRLSPADFRVPEGISTDYIRPDKIQVTPATSGPGGQEVLPAAV